MEKIFRKHFWILQAGFVVLIALMLAAIASNVIAAALVPLSVTANPGASGTGEDPGAAALTEMDLPYTLFGYEPEPELPPDRCTHVVCEQEGATCNPETGACELDEEEEEEEETVRDDGRCQESDIAINLVGTMVSPDGRYTMAILHNPSINKTQFAQVGTMLLAEAEVTAVERNRVMLLRNGRVECLRYGDQSARAQRISQAGGGLSTGPSTAMPVSPRNTRPDPQAAIAPPTARGGTLEDRMQTGIRRSQDGSYEVDRSLVEEVANNQALLEREAPQVQPNYVNGQPRGFRLQGIRSGSMFSRMGIRNGDVILSVNNNVLDSPQRALDLYDAMSTMDQVSLTVIRRGREQTIQYNVR